MCKKEVKDSGLTAKHGTLATLEQNLRSKNTAEAEMRSFLSFNTHVIYT
jgi:hypothetical protein